MSLSEIYDNFVWRIESISPSNAQAREKFRHNDVPLYMTEEQSLADRLVSVYWESGDEVQEFSDLTRRWSDVDLTVEVAYDATRDLDKLHALMLSDRNQIIKDLRDPAKFVGYNSSNAVTDIGLKNRVFTGDELDRDRETKWILRQTWRCTIEEQE